jgi:hypothetical protein
MIVIWVNTIIKHIDTWTIFIPGYEGSFMVYRSEEYQKQKVLSSTHTLLVSNCDTSHILVCGGYGKVRGSLNTLIIWVNTLLNHTNTGVILPGYEGSCMVYSTKLY